MSSYATSWLHINAHPLTMQPLSCLWSGRGSLRSCESQVGFLRSIGGSEQMSEQPRCEHHQDARGADEPGVQQPELRARNTLDEPAEPADQVVGHEQVQVVHTDHRAGERL